MPVLPPNCKPLSTETHSEIQRFYLNHCQPAGDKTCYDKRTKTHVTVMVRSKTKKQLYHELPSNLRVSYSTFAKLEPKQVRQAKRKTDMCEICVAGEEHERQAKRICQSNNGTKFITTSLGKWLHVTTFIYFFNVWQCRL